MVESEQELEARLDRMGEVLRRGQALAHPLGPKELAVIKAAVQQQWDLEHGQSQPPATVPPPEQVPPSHTQSPDHSRDQGHGHGHSH